MKELIVRFVQNKSIPSHEIEVIKKIKIIQDFKYITKFECYKLHDILDSMEKYYRIIHD